MPYSDVTTRANVASLTTSNDVSNDFLTRVVQSSAVMRMARRLPDMPKKQRRFPVLDMLPHAYFVNGDTGYKQTTKAAWTDKFMEVEELAVIVPIPESVLEDADYDIFAAIQPLLMEAFGVAFDRAVLRGENAPASWPTNIRAAAVAAGNAVTLATVVTAGGDLYDAVLSEGGLYEKIETDGYNVTGSMAQIAMKAKIRGLRADGGTGAPLFTAPGAGKYEFDGRPLDFPENGAIDPGVAGEPLMYAGDWRQLVYAMRKDITWKRITEGVITDNTGTVIFNLPQQDMIAIRAVMRLAWQVPNPINRINDDAATRYPFGVLL